MKTFDNVTVELEGNSYFDGAVTSRTVNFADGSKKTLGFMLPGEYEFGTAAAEIMEITSGELDVKLPESNEWISIILIHSFDSGSFTSNSPEVISISSAASVPNSYSPGSINPKVFLDPSAKFTVRLVTAPSK
jgi:uncharacterized protein YaiE (UPF0345 family)